jgi:hypothetical protein
MVCFAIRGDQIVGNRVDVGGQSTLFNPLMNAHVATYPDPVGAAFALVASDNYFLIIFFFFPFFFFFCV